MGQYPPWSKAGTTPPWGHKVEQGESIVTHDALRARNVDLPDSLVAMTGSSRLKNLRGFDIQSQKEEGRKDDDAYYATDGSL